MANKPKLIIITGRPGSGKTTLIKELSSELSLSIISRDQLKEDYLNTLETSHEDSPSDTNQIVTNSFFKKVESKLKNNFSLIIEAAFQHDVWEVLIEKVKDISDISIIICEIDEKLAHERCLKRELENPDHKYYHGKLAKTSQYESPNFPYLTILVSTENGYNPDLKSIINQLRSL